MIRSLFLCIATALAAVSSVGVARAETAAVAATLGTLSVTMVATPPPLDPTGDPAAWSTYNAMPLLWDVQHQRPASEAATARLTTDGRYIYARFDVKQREELLQKQHTNNVGDGTDDEVWVDLWPSGNKGFYYQFAATSNGTHYQYSSENTAYEPTWDSYGTAYPGGFTVTMKIPINVMRGTGNAAQWKVQFVRVVRSSGERQIWSYAPAQSNGDDVTFAGNLLGLKTASGSRAQPRIGLYGLGEAGSARSNLSTTRLGADFSIPVTQTASLFGTVHPDFSNVEIDQQTISPTAFARFYNEVRPFFAQANNYFDNFYCTSCPQISHLYTPSIPTPRDAYAIAGYQGRFKFAAIDAIGKGRIDAAQSFGYRSPDNHWRYFMERISADCKAVSAGACQFGPQNVHDVTFANGLSYHDGKHLDAYVNYGTDSGNLVLVPNRAQHYDTGFYAYGTTSGISLSTRKVGQYFNPADGLIQHPDVAGYAGYAAKYWQLSGNSKLDSAGFSVYVDRYHNHLGALDQSDTTYTFDVLTKSRIDVQASIGSSYLLQDFDCQLAACVFAPVSQNGLGVVYHSGTDKNPGSFPYHGSSSTPTSVNFNTGRFGPGRLDSWQRGSTMIAGTRGLLSLEADDTRQYLDDGKTNVQWLERLGYTYALTANSTFSLGVRRIIGTPPEVFAAAPSSCATVVTASQMATAAPCTGAWNLAFSYHRRSPHDDMYFGYGDASRLSTTPSFIVKLIHYFGAEKGT